MHFRLPNFDSRNARLRGGAAGFTLVEMLVSVALIAVLMLSVTEIFAIATRTISGGQAISAGVRDAQAGQAVMSHDFGSIAPDAPCLIIRSTRTAAFRNNQDLITAVDPLDPLKDVDPSGNSLNYSKLLDNFRNHRLDYLMFFARDRFPRQTGGALPLTATDPLIADQTTNEAAIYMQHVALTDNAAGFMAPGAGTVLTNPNNFFASQWALGRVAVLLAKPDTVTNKILDQNGTAQTFLTRGTGLTPLSTGSVAGASTLDSARFDLAGTTMSDYSTVLTSVITSGNPGATPWAIGTAYTSGALVTVGGTVYQAAANHTSDATNKPPNATNWTRSVTPVNWYTPLMCDARFQINPFVTKPITPVTASQQVPMFVPACTQFIVEFAGDYLTQDATTGAITAVGSDGKIDYVPGTNQIRWYGLPRDTNGNGVLSADEGDVVPVCDISRIAMPFEHAWPTTGTTTPTGAGIPVTSADYYSAAVSGTLQANPQYTVGWGPGDTDRPKLVRITLVIDRPEAAGNLLDGQTFEYVFKVGL